MTAGYRSEPGPARAMALAVEAAVRAARAADAEAFTDAIAELVRLDREQLAVLLGAVGRELLERGHPDGLDSDDAEAVLRDCVRSVEGWYPQLDREALLHALTGALGIGLPEAESPGPDGLDVLTSGLLLVAALVEAQREDLPALIDAGLRELMREQTVELP